MSGLLSFLQNSDAKEGAGLSNFSNMFDGMGKAVSSIGGEQTAYNEAFAGRNQDLLKKINTTDTIGDMGANMASSIPVIGGLISGGMKAGSSLMDSATDEYGLSTNKLQSAIGGLLNPIKGIGTLMNLGKTRDAANIAKQREGLTSASESIAQGAQISNSSPQYQAPSYGRKGMKLTRKTKFSH